jgi:hypothetical protein
MPTEQESKLEQAFWAGPRDKASLRALIAAERADAAKRAVDGIAKYLEGFGRCSRLDGPGYMLGDDIAQKIREESTNAK